QMIEKENNLKPEDRMKNKATGNLQRRTRNLQSDFGFTLLEIMVSVSIIAIVLVSIYKMQAQTISMNYEARFYATAPLLAQSKMTEQETKSLEDLTSDSGNFGDDFPGYSWSMAVDDVESEALGNTAKDLKKIDVTIFLNNDEFTYSLRTYRFQNW
ncbi:MAG: prepilin-type N-terminal cleavage/methylation domain-containing protein, partial [Desulfobacterales bacterium]